MEHDAPRGTAMNYGQQGPPRRPIHVDVDLGVNADGPSVGRPRPTSIGAVAGPTRVATAADQGVHAGQRDTGPVHTSGSGATGGNAFGSLKQLSPA